jgi:hypothetical protein
MFQAPSYKILSQELSADENENEFSSPLSSDGTDQDSLDLVLLEIGNKQHKQTVRKKRKHRTSKRMMGRIDGFESYEVSSSAQEDDDEKIIYGEQQRATK